VSQTIRQHWILSSSGFLLVLALFAALYFKANPAALMQETSRQAGFVLESLTVEGLHRTKRNEVLARLDMDAGMPLMAVNLSEVQERIEALPWVKRAAVMRVLPGDINIVVEEREPFALWQKDGHLSLIDDAGVVITEYGLAAFAELPIVVGETAPAEMTHLFDMLTPESSVSDKIKSIIRIGERRWDLVFENGIRLKLPADQATEYNSSAAWKKFIELEQKHRLLAREVSVIDMRIRGRLIMRVTPAGRRLMDGKEWAT
jgi:cell division protein FtsQ